MLVLIGIIVVLISTLGGFMLAGGHPAVLLHASEFVVIFGIAVGILVIASPSHVLQDVIAKTRLAFSSKKPGKEEYFDLLKLLYEIFTVGRRPQRPGRVDAGNDRHFPDSEALRCAPGRAHHQLTVQVTPVTSAPLSADSPHFGERLRSLPPAEQRRVVAEQFEAVLLRQLLGPTLQKLPGAGGNGVYGYMLTDAFAQKLSSGSGLGLARLLERQFTPPGEHLPAAPSPTASRSSGTPTARTP